MSTETEIEYLRQRNTELKNALEQILAISADREAFVMMGPRGFVQAEQIARAALGKP